MEGKSTSKKKSRIISVITRGIVLSVIVLGVMTLFDSGSRVTHCGRTRDGNTAYNLKTAISAFFTEYRHYPLVKEKLTIDLDCDSDEKLMTVLMGLDAKEKGSLNPRAIAFFSGKTAKKGSGGYRRGIQLLNNEKSARLWDSWGNLYRIRLDTNYDNRITNPADPSQQLPITILIWSAGKDGDFSTWKDNVKTW